MKLRSLGALALVVGSISLHAGAARADDSSPRHQRSRGAYAGGIALTSAGSLFLTVGTVFGIATVAAVANPPGDTGFGTLMAGAFGSLVAGGCLVVGAAMFVPGVVLIVRNHPTRDAAATQLPAPVRPLAHDAHEQLPLPRFIGVPLLSGAF